MLNLEIARSKLMLLLLLLPPLPQSLILHLQVTKEYQNITNWSW